MTMTAAEYRRRRDVEFLVAWDDGTWTTVVRECRDEQGAIEAMYTEAAFRKAVLIVVYNEDVTDEEAPPRRRG